MSLSNSSTAFLHEKGNWAEFDSISEEQDQASYDDSVGKKSATDTDRTGGVPDDDIQSIKNGLSKRESALVFRLRALVIVILLLVAVSISLAVFYQERAAQIKQFEAAFFGVAEKIIVSLEEATEAISALSALAVMAAVESDHQGEENWTTDGATFSGWPFITIDAFQERANNVRSLSKSIFVSVSPIVARNELSAWETYVNGNANNWM